MTTRGEAMKSLAVMVCLLLAAVPVLAQTSAERPEFQDLNKLNVAKQSSQKITDSVQARLPQAQIAALLTQLEDLSRGTGAIPAAEAGKLEEELAKQKQFWFEEYQSALKKSGATGEGFEESADLGKGFDDLFASAIGNNPAEISASDLKLIYQEYDNLSQTFQQMKLARFLSGNADGIPRYKGAADRVETAAIAADMQNLYLPGYQRRLQDGIRELRKILVDIKPTAN